MTAGVPQGTKLGPLLFLAMIDDFHTGCTDCKYIDDTTIYTDSNDIHDGHLQTALNAASVWTTGNGMKLNGKKPKDMIIDFRKESRDFPVLHLDGEVIKREKTVKLLGVHIADNLKWNSHIKEITKKASMRLHFLRLLKRANVPGNDLVAIYLAIIRSVLEYACPVWHTQLPDYLHKALESIQRRALRIICPSLDYNDALSLHNLPKLHDRRTDLCWRFFSKITLPGSKLLELIPPKRTRQSLRSQKSYSVPRCCTNRLENSLIYWCAARHAPT